MTERDTSWLTDQADYLLGATLMRREWVPAHVDEDHDHCALCWDKFSNLGIPGELTAGFCTSDDRHWVCQQCADAFRDRFQWRLIDGSTVGHS